jgi:dnd system-associated protein 4
MLAAAATDETEILGDDRVDDRLTIFEEYANGGLEIINERLSAQHRPPLDTLLDLVFEYMETEAAKGGLDLEAIATELSG